MSASRWPGYGPLRSTASLLAPFALLLALASTVGCATAGTAPTAPTAAAPTVEEPTTAPPSLPGAVRWVQSSAEYKAAVIQAYQLASLRLDSLAQGREPGTWAVALDADETVVSNLPYQVDLESRGERYSPESWAVWVHKRQAEVLPGALDFLAEVRRRGGRIAIVTNRVESLCEATRDNLRHEGVPFDVVLCRPEPGSGEKEPRWDRVMAGTAAPGLPAVEILLWIGDNIQDFPHLDQALRHQDAGSFADFGDRFILIPNPLYGSWERN